MRFCPTHFSMPKGLSVRTKHSARLMGTTAAYDLHRQMCDNGHQNIPHRSTQRTLAKQRMPNVLCCEFHPEMDRSLSRSPKPTRLQVRQRWQAKGHTHIICYCVERRWYKDVHHPLFAFLSLVLASTLPEASRNHNLHEVPEIPIKLSPYDITSNHRIIPAEIAFCLFIQDDVGLSSFSLVWAEPLTNLVCVAVRQQAQSIGSSDTAPRSKGPQNLAAVERYLHEEDRYKEFLINGPQRSPYPQLISKKPVQGNDKSEAQNQGGNSRPPKEQGLISDI